MPAEIQIYSSSNFVDKSAPMKPYCVVVSTKASQIQMNRETNVLFRKTLVIDKIIVDLLLKMVIVIIAKGVIPF